MFAALQKVIQITQGSTRVVLAFPQSVDAINTFVHEQPEQCVKAASACIGKLYKELKKCTDLGLIDRAKQLSAQIEELNSIASQTYSAFLQ